MYIRRTERTMNLHLPMYEIVDVRLFISFKFIDQYFLPHRTFLPITEETPPNTANCYHFHLAVQAHQAHVNPRKKADYYNEVDL